MTASISLNVDDDIALQELPKPRGVAGTPFVRKIAGAMAETGAALDEVTAAAERVIASTKSIGMSLDTCTVPGSPKENRIGPGKAEQDLGIHGEAGVEQIDYLGAGQAVDAVTAKLAAVMEDKPHVALLDNLGGASVLEMSIIANDLIKSPIGKIIKPIVGPAALMTSPDMRGFSVSVYPHTTDDQSLLTASCGPSARPGCKVIMPPRVVELPDGLRPIQPIASEHTLTAAFLTKCCQNLIDAEADLNALDAKSGDGDTGSTLAGASRDLVGALDRLPLADHTQLFRAIGQELTQTMGGSSGVLLAIFFAAAGDAASSGLGMVTAPKEGLARMQKIGGAELGDRTMVDALKPALDELERNDFAAAARSGAERTATIVHAKAGPASYIHAEQLQGHVDPGAAAVARLFEHLAS